MPGDNRTAVVLAILLLSFIILLKLRRREAKNILSGKGEGEQGSSYMVTEDVTLGGGHRCNIQIL